MPHYERISNLGETSFQNPEAYATLSANALRVTQGIVERFAHAGANLPDRTKFPPPIIVATDVKLLKKIMGLPEAYGLYDANSNVIIHEPASSTNTLDAHRAIIEELLHAATTHVGNNDIRVGFALFPNHHTNQPLNPGELYIYSRNDPQEFTRLTGSDAVEDAPAARTVDPNAEITERVTGLLRELLLPEIFSEFYANLYTISFIDSKGKTKQIDRRLLEPLISNIIKALAIGDTSLLDAQVVRYTIGVEKLRGLIDNYEYVQLNS